MDEIDQNLIEAWDKVVARCAEDPVFAAKREAMGRREIMRRPMRAWCLAIRASDTRIGPMHFHLQPRGAVEEMEPHKVMIESEGIGLMTRPVVNPYPGMRMVHAAKALGISYEVMTRWAKKGVNGIKLRYQRPGADGYWGKKSPWVCWEGELDPGHMEGTPPDRFWGSMWRRLNERVPEAFNQWVRRSPRWRDDPKYGRVFRGWDWECPGGFDAAGKRRRCGRLVRWLYAAVPVWRVQDFLGEKAGIELPAQAGERTGPMRFACKACVGWIGMHGTDKDPQYPWNQFVRHMSGGMLLGHEVKMPAELEAWKRKKRYTARGRASGGLKMAKVSGQGNRKCA